MHTEVDSVPKPNKKEKEREIPLQQKVARHDRNSEKKKRLRRRGGKLTEVVRTPHSSNFSKVGVGALGVSMNSNSDSLPLTLCGLDMFGSRAS